MTMSSRRYPKNRGISLYLLIKNRKITKTALKWAKTVKTTPNFHQRSKIIRICEFKNIFWRGPFLRILGQFFNFVNFYEKRKNSHRMGPKPRNYLKITKNIENNPKLIKKEIEIEIGTYLWFYGLVLGNFCPIFAILAILA